MGVVASLSCILLLCFASISDAVDISGWELDDSLASERNVGCDFAVLSLDDLHTFDMPSFNYPFIVKGMASSWAANQRWAKTQFTELYGSKSIRTGSESSIVHSGGQAEQHITIAGMLNLMQERLTSAVANESTERLGDSFIFDTTVLESIPELQDDFTVPDLFASWDNRDQEATAKTWRILSLGPSKSGLPFHSHGQTWLAVVHGVKKWFLYPPGYSPSRDIDTTFNPMFPVSDWLQHVHGQLLRNGHPKPPIIDLTFSPTAQRFEPQQRGVSVEEDVDDPGYRPLECVQEPGDVVYVPSRWSHMTINLGETIAVGGQEALSDQDRYALAKHTLQKFTDNYDALRDVGLALSNIVSQRLRQLRETISGLQNDEGLIEFRGTLQQLDSLLRRTRDTWVVLYYNSSIWGNLRKLLQNFALLAQDLHGEANVAVIDLKGKVKREEMHNAPAGAAAVMGKTGPVGTVYIADEEHVYSRLPVVKIHRGATSLAATSADFDSEMEGHVSASELAAFKVTGERATATTATADSSNGNEFKPDVAGVEYLGNPADINAVREYVREFMRSAGLVRGSVDRVPVSIKSQMQTALSYLKKALEVKPLQPELRSMIGETAGLAHDFDTMHRVIHDGDKLLSSIDRSTISELSLASGYHKLAAAYLSMSMREDAIPLLRKSLLVMPTFLPALFELAHVFADMGDEVQALRAVKSLRDGIEAAAVAATTAAEKLQQWREEADQIEQTVVGNSSSKRDEL